MYRFVILAQSGPCIHRADGTVLPTGNLGLLKLHGLLEIAVELLL